jgi:hypothetical protein
MLFSSLGVQRRAIWTGIYRSKSLSTFLDITRYPPITKTPHETIDDSQLSQDSSNAVQSVALQMVGQQLQYVTRDKDDNVNTQTLCTHVMLQFALTSSSVASAKVTPILATNLTF